MYQLSADYFFISRGSAKHDFTQSCLDVRSMNGWPNFGLLLKYSGRKESNNYSSKRANNGNPRFLNFLTFFLDHLCRVYSSQKMRLQHCFVVLHNFFNSKKDIRRTSYKLGRPGCSVEAELLVSD